MRSVETASSFRPTNVDVADAATQAGRDSTAMSRAGKHTPLATSYSLPATAAWPPSKIQNRAKPQRLLPQLCNLTNMKENALCSTVSEAVRVKN